MFDLCDGENDSCKTMLLFINSSIANALNTNHNIQDPSSSMEVNETTQRGHSSSINHNQQRFQSMELTKSNVSKTSSMNYTDRV